MGRNKALMPFLGRPLIEHIIDQFQPIASELIINTNDPDPFEYLGLQLVADVVKDVGALGGLYTAMVTAKNDLVALIACDMPFASAQLSMEQVKIMAREGVDVVIPETDDGLEPFHALYRRKACLQPIENMIATGNRRMVSWFSSVNVRKMHLDEIVLATGDQPVFMNVNTPEEFSLAEVWGKTHRS